MVGIATQAELATAWDEMLLRAAKAAAHGAILGFLVQEMVRGGIEMFAGIKTDPEFGPVLVCGMGGIGVEIWQDFAIRPLPLTEGAVAAMIGGLRGAPLVLGGRGAEPADVPALVATIERFADYAFADRDRIAEIDLNPIKVLPRGQGCRIVDALILPRHGASA
jgi:acetyltransferase